MKIKDHLTNLQNLQFSQNALEVLFDIEGYLSHMGVFGFKNWFDGELVEGPIFEKYYITTSWMWPLKSMPDPKGGRRLLRDRCMVSYRKENYEYPEKIQSEEDYQENAKVAKILKKQVWVVELVIPRDLLGVEDLRAANPEPVEDTE